MSEAKFNLAKLSKILKIIVRVAAFFGASYLLINFLARNFLSQDTIAIFFVFIAIIIEKAQTFLIDWSPIFIYVYLYEFFRGHAGILQTFLKISTHQTILLNLDKLMFGNRIPVLITQSLIRNKPTTIDYIAFFWYTSFFWIPILTGFVLWFRSRNLFKEFRNSYVLLCFMALLTFILFPASPPWLASQQGHLPHLITDTWGRLWGGQLTLGIFNSVGYNPVAPFPSLHIGWSVLCAFFYQRFFAKSLKGFSRLFYLYPIVMCFVVTYTSDHYVIDMIGGTLYALTAIYISFNYHVILKLIKKAKRKLALKKPLSKSNFLEVTN